MRVRSVILPASTMVADSAYCLPDSMSSMCEMSRIELRRPRVRVDERRSSAHDAFETGDFSAGRIEVLLNRRDLAVEFGDPSGRARRSADPAGRCGSCSSSPRGRAPDRPRDPGGRPGVGAGAGGGSSAPRAAAAPPTRRSAVAVPRATERVSARNLAGRGIRSPSAGNHSALSAGLRPWVVVRSRHECVPRSVGVEKAARAAPQRTPRDELRQVFPIWEHFSTLPAGFSTGSCG